MDLRTYMFLHRIQTRKAAKELGMDETHLSRIIHKRLRPSIPVATKIEAFTKGEVSLAELRRPVK